MSSEHAPFFALLPLQASYSVLHAMFELCDMCPVSCSDRGNRHQLDHYDHIWGIYITKSGKRRRMDLIFVPPDCHSWVFAYIGWSGSKQYLRFMRTHAGEGLAYLRAGHIHEKAYVCQCEPR